MVPRRQRKGGAALSSPSTPSTPSFASPSSSWVDPVFHFGAGASSGLTGGLGVLPWWAENPGNLNLSPNGADGGSAPTQSVAPTYAGTPESHHSPGYMGQAAPGYTMGGSPTGDLGPGYELNVNQAARLGGSLGSYFFGVPSQVTSRAIRWYGHRTGADNPFPETPPEGVTVTNNDPNAPPPEPRFRYEGYGSDPYGGGFGHVYYGPSRGDTLADYGDASMNDFGAAQADYWNSQHNGQNIAGVGMGGFGTGWHGGTGAAGGADLIFSGTASPWDWGGGLYY